MFEPKESTREKLLQAALKVFARKGFLAATVREICAEAGANVAAVNYHFNGKENLYYEVLRYIFSCPHKVEDPLEGEAGKGRPPEERLASFIRTVASDIYGEFIKEDEGWDMGAIFLSEMARPTKFLDDVIHEFACEKHKALESIISDYLGLEADDPIVMKCKFSVISQLMHHALVWPMTSRVYPELQHPRRDPMDLAEHVLEFSLGGLNRIRRSLDNSDNGDGNNE